ncbi:methyl-accepting chemotaxis protein [Paenibacillus sp. MSJ-34]|uniref:methyl-accepting chemotaxis protein n=1 Tax=Paenibacillus sp. MSJ-34 TaxID=2841529 RepID=UPI001C103DF1|nr:methyl-accepting chemotaxis protein [Paenibacillus sp. MSJ-34]MBU5444792.1 CZB domain-containing protein [Paenibacillus sp. MSJ-34]
MRIFTQKTKSWNDYINFSRSTDISQVGDRAKERLVFLGINQDTLNHVREAAHILLPYKAKLVNHFYENLQSIDHLKKIILEHSTIDRLRQTMERYLDQFLHGEINNDYIMSRILIGQVHSRIHLTAEHFISAHHLLTQLMTSILMEKVHDKPHQMIQMVLAVQKLAAYDQQLIVEVYMEETFKSFLFGVSDLLNHTTQLDTTKQLIVSMDRQIEESYSVTAATEEMSASIHEVANHAVRVAEGTDQAVQSADQSKVVINDALDDISKIGHVYHQVIEQVNQLDREIGQTQAVVKIIREIADQTNLLALNASIEAARAGEQGKGFSVVASEVRKLAEHTKEEIARITSNMDSLSKVSAQVIRQIKQTGDLVEKTVTGAQYAREVITQIVSMMKDTSNSTSHIAAMTEEQSAVVTEITERNSIIHDHSSSTQKVAEETARIIYDLSIKMDEYRNSFFGINVKLNSNDLVRVAKTDHLLWKWKIYNMVLGISKIDSNQVTSHESCRLGKWYYGDLPLFVKNSDAYKELEEPHKEVHYYAKIAVEHYEKGNLLGAEQSLELLEQASDKVIHLLSKIEVDLSKK